MTTTKISANEFKKHLHEMEHTSCSIIGVNEDLKVQIGILDAQIKADKKSKEEFERYLKVLNDKRDEVLARLAKNGEYVQQFDASSAQAAYRKMTSDIASIYEKAQMGHAKGIKMLEKEFGYHPSFKRPGDTFTGIAFRPMKP